MKIEAAKDYIDMAASEARHRYISSGVGQESTYLMKAQQSKDFKAAGYTGDIPSLIQAEMIATGLNAQDATDYILTQEAQWAYLAGQIETIRRTGKIAVSNMTDPIEISNYCDSVVEQLNAI